MPDPDHVETPLNKDLIEYIDNPLVMPCTSGNHFYVRRQTLQTIENEENQKQSQDYKNFIPSAKAKSKPKSNKVLVQLSSNSLDNIKRKSDDNTEQS